jgi:hypothetical protein
LEVELADQLVQGAKLSFNGSLLPAAGYVLSVTALQWRNINFKTYLVSIDLLIRSIYIEMILMNIILFSAKNVKVGLEYKQDYIFSNASLDVFKGPAVSADVAVG